MAKPTIAQFNRIIQIGSMLSTEHDIYKLLDTILMEARGITNCDAGTLYLSDGKALRFAVMHNDTMKTYEGTDGTPPSLPPVPLWMEDGAPNHKNVSAFVANNGDLVSIADVYNSKHFNFQGTKQYDQITGYRTRSMLVIPLKNSYDEIVGVLQLINAVNSEGETVAFGKSNRGIVLSLSSQAAIVISNNKFLEEIKELFNSFVMTMAKSIDERSPHTANHTKKVAQYAFHFLEYIVKYQLLPLDSAEAAQVVMAAWLHDIGKLATDMNIMDKTTRLGNSAEPVFNRLYLVEMQKELALSKGNLSQEEYARTMAELQELRELILAANAVGFLEESVTERIICLSKNTYVDRNGKEKEWLTEKERGFLSIKKGTLSADERSIMESHAVSTANILDNIQFIREYRNVAKYAASHHEYLDGTGYPRGLKGEEIPLPTRILTVLDVFEALTARDRPYKRGMPAEEALAILDSMVVEGKIDGNIVNMLRDSKVWEEQLI